MKKIQFEKYITMLALLMVVSAFSVAANVDLALQDLKATQQPEAYSAVHLQFTVKNTGDEPVITRLQVQPFTPDNPEGLGIYDLLYLGGTGKLMDQVTVYKQDGTTRIETVKERQVLGKQVMTNGQDFKFSQFVDTIQLFPEEYVILNQEVHFRDAKAVTAGTHEVGLRFVGYQLKPNLGIYKEYRIGENPESNAENNEALVTITVNKRAPLVESAGYQLEGYGKLKDHEYYMHDYWEYHEAGKLCTTVEQKEICLLDKSDGINFQFTVNGQQAKLDWAGKLLQSAADIDLLSATVKWMLQNHTVIIDGVAIKVAADPGMLFTVVQ